MSEFIQAAADDLVSGGVGARYADTGISVQVTARRDTNAPHIVLFKQSGGLPFPFAAKEQYAFQVLIDSDDVVSGQTIARQVYDRFHNRTNVVLSGHQVQWLRAVTLPQAVPMGPSAGQPPERFMFSVNFDALLLKDGGD